MNEARRTELINSLPNPSTGEDLQRDLFEAFMLTALISFLIGFALVYFAGTFKILLDPYFMGFIGAVAAFNSSRAILLQVSNKQVLHVKGNKLFEDKEALKMANKELAVSVKSSGKGLKIGGVQLSNDRETKHALILGKTGAGKTTLFKPYLKAAIDRGDLMIVYDNKTEFTEIIGAKNDKFDEKTVILGPWDERSINWRLGLDIVSKQDAKQFADNLINSDEDNIFIGGGKAIITGAIVYLQETMGTEWQASDLHKIIHLKPLEYVDLITDFHPEIKALLSFDDKDEPVTATANMFQNASKYAGDFLDILSDCEGGRDFSIKEWLGQLKTGDIKTQIIILQGNKQYSALQRALYSNFISFSVSILNSPSFKERKAKERGLWYFLDEFPQLGKLSNIQEVAEIGRSKGARLIMGMQAVSQVYSVYGRDDGKTLTGILQTYAAGALAPEDAQALSDMFGKRTIAVKQRSESLSGNEGMEGAAVTTSYSWNVKDENIVNADDFGNLKQNAKGVELMLFLGTNTYKIFQTHLKFPKIRQQYVPKKWTGDVPEYERDTLFKEAIRALKMKVSGG